MTLRRIGSNQLLKHVEIDFDTVRLLPRGGTKRSQSGETSPVRLLGLVPALSPFRAEPGVLLGHALVRPKPVVIRARGVRGIGPRHDAAARSVPAYKQIVAKVHVGGRLAEDLFPDDGIVIDQQSRRL